MRHPHSTPLRTIGCNGRNNMLRGVRPSNTAKRKSAVELLQETKAFYVKSETVLDKKQEFRPTRSPDSYTAPSQPAKSPRCSQYGSELQDRLRMLLDFDSKENIDTRATGVSNNVVIARMKTRFYACIFFPEILRQIRL